MSNKREKVQLATEVIEELPLQERVALAYGFPLPNTSNFSNFINADGEDDEHYETDVNGAWKELKENPMMDFDGGFDFADDDFDNFLTKKSRARAKRKREIKKQLKAQGIKGKEKRKTARKQALKEIPKDKIKDIAKRTIKKIGRGLAVTSLALPRASFISLLAINFRGSAWKLNDGITNPKYKKTYLPKIKAKWYKLGGKWSALEKVARNGAKRKPFLCGKKCKKKLAEKGLKFSGVDASSTAQELINNVEFYNPNTDSFSGSQYSNAAGVDDAAVAVWVGIGSAVLGAMTSVVATIKTSKAKQQELANAKEIANKELALMDKKTKREADLVEAQIRNQSNPINQILNNPNLTKAQKDSAIAQVQDATSKETEGTTKKYLIWGGAILVGIIALAFVFKPKK